MAFQAVPDTAEITIIYTQNLETVTNTIHAEKPGGYDQAAIDALALSVDDDVGLNLLPLMTLDCLYLRTEVRGLAVENDLFASNNDSSGPGLDAVEGLPNNVTLSLKKESGFTGRSARGRWYFIGLPLNELSTNENQWAQTAVDNAVIAVQGIRIGIQVGPWTPVIVSRFTGGLPRAVGVTFPWVNTTAVNRNVDSQRGRLTR